MDTFGDPPGRRATVNNVSERLQDVMAALVPVSEPREPEDFIAAIAVAHAIEEQSRELLQSSVLAARESGATWVDIGKSLGISKQAAQKRFAAPAKLSARSLDPGERLIGPVGIFDAIDELNLAGRYGWHSVGFGVAHHHVVHSDKQWEHRLVLGTRKASALMDDGWVVVGRSFPYVLLKRDTGVSAVTEPTLNSG